MKQKTSLEQSVEIADNKAKYDTQVKNIIANKIILAWILKYTAIEFKNEPINSIIELIEGEPEVASVPVYPGKTNQSPKITGISTQDKVPYEGEVTYDIRFYAYTPDRQKHIKLIVNIEAQKKFNPGYDLTTRGIFYCARSLSAQKDTEFTADNYDDIKKVYSIWICMESPNYISNTVTSYGIQPLSIYGNYNGENSRYDLLNVVMICLGKASNKKSSENQYELIRLLDTLLSNDLAVEEKKQVLVKDFGIEPSLKLEREMNVMCNLSDLVEERAIEKGIKKGIEKGIEQGIEQGIEKGDAIRMIELVDNLARKVGYDKAYELLEVNQEEYQAAKRLIGGE